MSPPTCSSHTYDAAAQFLLYRCQLVTVAGRGFALVPITKFPSSAPYCVTLRGTSLLALPGHIGHDADGTRCLLLTDFVEKLFE